MSERTSHRRQAARHQRAERRLTMREARQRQREYPQDGLDLRRPWWGGAEA